MFGEKTPNFCADHVFGWNVPGDCGENPNHSIWHQGEVELIDSCIRIPLLCTLAFTPAGIYGCDPHMGVVLNIPSMIWVGWWVINMWIRPVWSPEIGACGWRPLPATCTEKCLFWITNGSPPHQSGCHRPRRSRRSVDGKLGGWWKFSEFLVSESGSSLWGSVFIDDFPS